MPPFTIFFIWQRYTFWRKRGHEISDGDVRVRDRRVGVSVLRVIPGPTGYSVAFEEKNVETCLSKFAIRDESTVRGANGWSVYDHLREIEKKGGKHWWLTLDLRR